MMTANAFVDPGSDPAPRSSLCPRQDLLQFRKELLPAVLGALVVLRLIGPEAGLLHAQAGPRRRRGESESHDSCKTKGAPRIGQRLVRLDDEHLTINNAVPVRLRIHAQTEMAADDRLKIVLHQPLRDQV